MVVKAVDTLDLLVMQQIMIGINPTEARRQHLNDSQASPEIRTAGTEKVTVYHVGNNRTI